MLSWAVCWCRCWFWRAHVSRMYCQIILTIWINTCLPVGANCRWVSSIAVAHIQDILPWYSWSQPRCNCCVIGGWNGGSMSLAISGYGMSVLIAMSPNHIVVRTHGWMWSCCISCVNCQCSVQNNALCAVWVHSRKCHSSSGSCWQDGQRVEPECRWALDALRGNLLLVREQN